MVINKKECDRKYRERHKEKIKKYLKEYYRRNKGKLLKQSKERYERIKLNPLLWKRRRKKSAKYHQKYKITHEKQYKESRKKQRERPEVKEKHRKYMKQYKKTPRYKEKQKIRTHAYKCWRKKVRERDGFKCVNCGSKNDLQMHEKKYEYPQRLENIETVCRKCHYEIHKNSQNISI